MGEVTRHVVLPDPASAHEAGRCLAGWLRAGDLVLLSGDLGAGKTTLTQGIGAGLGVQGAMTSPTFVIARHHRRAPVVDGAAAGGPGLVHVDAYRLGGSLELDDLDLDTDLAENVTVIEWGEGLAERLDEAHLRLVLTRVPGPPASGTDDAEDADDVVDTDAREMTVTGTGERWPPAALDAVVGSLLRDHRGLSGSLARDAPQ